MATWLFTASIALALMIAFWIVFEIVLLQRACTAEDRWSIRHGLFVRWRLAMVLLLLVATPMIPSLAFADQGNLLRSVSDHWRTLPWWAASSIGVATLLAAILGFVVALFAEPESEDAPFD